MLRLGTEWEQQDWRKEREARVERGVDFVDGCSTGGVLLCKWNVVIFYSKNWLTDDCCTDLLATRMVKRKVVRGIIFLSFVTTWTNSLASPRFLQTAFHTATSLLLPTWTVEKKLLELEHYNQPVSNLLPQG